jgi:glycosyltransferase involved in cell wall biosynthesis
VLRTDVVAVVPAYQAVATIAEVVSGVRRRLEKVVVVDDGSDDGTSEAARAAGAAVERLETNRGKGSALRRGIARALALEPLALVLLDADGQHDPGDLDAFLDAWDEGRADLIIGARLADPAKIPAARYWTNYIGSRILSWMCGLDLEDSQSGYRLISAKLIRAIDLSSEGYAVESEMLIKAARLGARIEHVRVRTIYNDGGSHFRPLRDTFRISCASIYFKVFDDGRDDGHEPRRVA